MTIKNWSLAAYRALPDPITQEGPWALENRPPWDLSGHLPPAQRGNYYANRGHAILGICLHITAGISNYTGPDKSADNTTIWGQTTTTQASWAACIDSDSIIPCLQEHRVAWVQGVPGYNFNRPLIGVEIGKRTADWTIAPQTWVDATLRNVAAYCAPRVIRYNIPLELVTDRDEVQRRINAGRPVGFTYHWRLTPGTRSDPGLAGGRETFPWARFLVLLREEIAIRRGQTPAPTPIPDPDPHVARAQAALNDLLGSDLPQPLAVDGYAGELTTGADALWRAIDPTIPPMTPAAAWADTLEDTMSKIDTLLDEVRTLRTHVNEIRYATRRVSLSEADRQMLATGLTTITPAGLAKVSALQSAAARRAAAADGPEQRAHVSAEADRVIAAITEEDDA